MQKNLPSMAHVLTPTPGSLAHRAKLAQAISALRRIKPRVPFWHLAAHRIPTLWSLYRGLLRDAPTLGIRWRMTMFMRRYQHLTSPRQTKEKLNIAHKWLEVFRKAKGGETHSKDLLSRYDRLISVKREKAQMKAMLTDEYIWQQRLRSARAILTGGYLRASLFNRPLPRMRRQPIHVTMMIRKRRLGRDRRGAVLKAIGHLREDLKLEGDFERHLQKKVAGESAFSPVYKTDQWLNILGSHAEAVHKSLVLDYERRDTPYSATMVAMIRKARQEKIRNKTREKERERHGEVLRQTISRRNQGPPSHVLVNMTKQQTVEDKIVRSISDVGYVGQLKRKMGHRMVDDETWRREDGLEARRGWLKRSSRRLSAENERRRKLVRDLSGS